MYEEEEEGREDRSEAAQFMAAWCQWPLRIDSHHCEREPDFQMMSMKADTHPFEQFKQCPGQQIENTRNLLGSGNRDTCFENGCLSFLGIYKVLPF